MRVADGGRHSETVRGQIYNISYDISCAFLNLVVRSTYDSDLRCAKISLKNIISQFMNAVANDLMILQVNHT